MDSRRTPRSSLLGGIAIAMSLLSAPRFAGAACDVNYVGPSDGLWQTPGNWDGNAVPTSAQGACIPSGKGTIVIGNGVAATVENITATSAVQVASGGTLAIADSVAAYSNGFSDVTVASGGTVSSAGSYVAITGQAVIDGTFSPGTQLTSGTLSGTGTVGGSLNNLAGTVRPGGAGVVGTLNIGLAYNQQPGGTLEIDLASDSSFDRVDGPHFNHFLDGNIIVNLIGGYTPSVGTSWSFIPPDGFGTQVNVQVTPPEFSAHSIPTGAEITLDSPLSSSTTTSTTVPGTTTTLLTCGDGALDAGEACDGSSFGAATCAGVDDQSCRLCTTGCTVDCTQCVATPVDGFILPFAVVVKRNTSKPEKSRLTTTGIFDTGPEGADLGASATLQVGSLTVPATSPQQSHGGFVLKSGGLLFKVRPAKTGSSKGRFTLRLQQDLTGAIDPAAPLAIRFTNPSVDGRGVVRLTSNRYRLRRQPGDLLEPALYLAKVRAQLKGGGKDAVTLQVGFATNGQPPASAPDVTLRFGSTYSLFVPGSTFGANGQRFTATAGSARVTLDYGRELLTIQAKGVDLGTFADGPQAVRVALQLGAATQANDVRLVRKGKSLKY